MGEKEITTKQLYELMRGLVVSNKEIKDQICQSRQEIKDEINTVREELSKELHQIRLENEKLKEENKTLREQLHKCEKGTKKYKLLIYNFEEQSETTSDLAKFIEVLHNQAEVSCEPRDFRNFFRLGKIENKKNRPISIEVVSYSLKENILKNASKLKDKKIYVTIDYTQKEYSERKILRKYLLIAREEQKNAEIKNNTLYVDGTKYTVEDLRKRETEEENLIEEEELLKENNAGQKRKPGSAPEAKRDNNLKKILRSGRTFLNNS